jgi:RNA polymerase sigma-70 factor, ECF subfamily
LQARSAEAGRENDGFTRLVERQSRFAFRVAYAVVRNPQDAEDVVQETFLSLFRSGAWQQMHDEKAFLARAVWRQAVDRLRARPKHNESLNEADVEPRPILKR